MMNTQTTRIIDFSLSNKARLIRCNKCKWEFIIYAIIENERECPDVEPIIYSYMEQVQTTYCPACGVKIDEYNEI